MVNQRGQSCGPSPRDGVISFGRIRIHLTDALHAAGTGVLRIVWSGSQWPLVVACGSAKHVSLIPIMPPNCPGINVKFLRPYPGISITHIQYFRRNSLTALSSVSPRKLTGLLDGDEAMRTDVGGLGTMDPCVRTEATPFFPPSTSTAMEGVGFCSRKPNFGVGSPLLACIAVYAKDYPGCSMPTCRSTT